MKTVKKLWIENERIFIETVNGEILSQPMCFFRRLKNATEQQQAQWSESRFGLHWKNIDEDISFESFYWEDNDPKTLFCS